MSRERQWKVSLKSDKLGARTDSGWVSFSVQESAVANKFRLSLTDVHSHVKPNQFSCKAQKEQGRKAAEDLKAISVSNAASENKQQPSEFFPAAFYL